MASLNLDDDYTDVQSSRTLNLDDEPLDLSSGPISEPDTENPTWAGIKGAWRGVVAESPFAGENYLSPIEEAPNPNAKLGSVRIPFTHYNLPIGSTGQEQFIGP